MTPQEIFEYKRRWMMKDPYVVRIDSNLDIEGKQWCRKTIERHQWSFVKYTDLYEHTFFFEDAYIGQQFEHEFIRWVNK